jgi:hypothetical protein
MTQLVKRAPPDNGFVMNCEYLRDMQNISGFYEEVAGVARLLPVESNND